MRKTILVLMMMVLGLLLVACDGTGDTNTQATSAQNYQPSIAGFKAEESDDIVESFANVVVAGSAVTGNVPLAATIERVNATIACLTDAGAISARTYVQEENVGVVPQAGVSLVVNKTRVDRNIFSCIATRPFSASSVLDIEPCAETGSFTSNNEEFYYAYIGAGSNLCAGFAQHFNTYNPTVEASQ